MHTEDHERPLRHRIFDSREDDVDVHDPILNSWIKPLLRERRPICFERLFNLDVIPLREAEAAAAVAATEAEAAGVGPTEGANMGANEAEVAADEVAKLSAEVESQGKELLEIKNNMVNLTKTVESGLNTIFELLGGQDTRLKAVESLVQSQKYGSDFGFDDSSPRTRYGGGTSGGTSVGVTVGREDLEKEKESGHEEDKEKESGHEEDKEKEKGQEKGQGKEIATDGEDDMDAEDEDEAEAVDDGVMLCKKRISKPSKVSKTPFTLLKTKKRKKKTSEKKD